MPCLSGKGYICLILSAKIQNSSGVLKNIGFSGDPMKAKKTLNMITQRAVEEGIAMEIGKTSRQYFDACSIIEMNETGHERTWYYEKYQRPCKKRIR
jgi:hypothetical protein